jgi:hypothetical protein
LWWKDGFNYLENLLYSTNLKVGFDLKIPQICCSFFFEGEAKNLPNFFIKRNKFTKMETEKKKGKRKMRIYRNSN